MVGYGECSSHREQTIASWARQGNALQGRIESGEDSYLFIFGIGAEEFIIVLSDWYCGWNGHTQGYTSPLQNLS